ncbi:MAG: RecX family transcriptional regulator [Chloroflexota bacterium]|nr:RecX family transcriptional regulator [Chloroflexota bacterium]
MFKITDIKPQKRDSQRINVFLDGEFGFGVARAVAPWLKIGEELSREKIKELQDKDETEKAYQRALNYLSYRERSEEEVCRNLRKHDVSDAAIEEVLERLRRNTLLSDKRFAAKWVENRDAFHPRSRRALSVELRQKGVPRPIIDEVLAEVDDHKMAYKVAQKKLRRLQGLEWPDFRKKLHGYLGRRGFSYGVTAEVTKQVWDERELGD